MGDTSDSLLPPSTQDPLTPATPSGLTPNTRSEAEAALSLNSTSQTDSAAPTTPLPHTENGNEAQKAYRHPLGPIRTSSTNYEAALRDAHKQASASSDMSTDTAVPMTDMTNLTKVDSPLSSTMPFPPPGQGVVPLHTGIGSGQSDVVKKVRPSGLTLGDLGRQMSWSEQDRRHLMQGGLMSAIKEDAGYGSGHEGRGVGRA
jgi:hypothetical protein